MTAISVGVAKPKRSATRMSTGRISAGVASIASRATWRMSSGGVFRREIEPPRLPPADRDEAGGHQQAGQHAGDEQVADADAADHGVEDHRDRGRDQDVDHRRGRVVGSAKPRRVALTFCQGSARSRARWHWRRRCRRRRRTRRSRPRSWRARRRAPASSARPRSAAAPAQLALHDERAGQDEERQRQHREGLGLLEHLLRDEQQRQLPSQSSAIAGGDHQRMRDRDRPRP